MSDKIANGKTSLSAEEAVESPPKPQGPTSQAAEQNQVTSQQSQRETKNLPKEIKQICDEFLALGLLGSVGGGIFSLYFIFLSPGRMDESDKALLCLSMFIVAWGCFQFFVARGIANRKSWSKRAGVLVSIVLLTGFPIGTIWGGIMLARLFGPEVKDWFPVRPVQPDPSEQEESRASLPIPAINRAAHFLNMMSYLSWREGPIKRSDGICPNQISPPPNER